MGEEWNRAANKGARSLTWEELRVDVSKQAADLAPLARIIYPAVSHVSTGLALFCVYDSITKNKPERTVQKRLVHIIFLPSLWVNQSC